MYVKLVVLRQHTAAVRRRVHSEGEGGCVSRKLDYDAENADFKLGDTVTFDHEGIRLTGEVVRVYNTRLLYHVLVNCVRYLVSYDDNPQKEVA